MKKLKFIFPALCALAMCLVACEPEPNVTTDFFSVSPEMKVHFAPGNLQYQASTDTWRFAENAWDIIGSDNNHISSTYDGWIDLFCWGTGENPTSASTDIKDFLDFVDWGHNAISNGENLAFLWRTLNDDEWQYLFEGRKNAARLYGTATIKTQYSGVCGLIILPDMWSGSTVPFNAGMKGWSNNTYSMSEWAELQKAGAVFLPAAGHRRATTTSDVNMVGTYWSSSSRCAGDAGSLEFSNEKLYPQMHCTSTYGYSVRLVKELEY